MQELGLLQHYQQDWNKDGALRAAIARKDAVIDLTGGGITTTGVHAIAEFLAGCYTIEQSRQDKPYPIYRGEWQREMVDHIGAHELNSIQAPRRLGKSYCVSLWATAYMAAGYRVIMAMPTMQQGSRLIFRQVSRNISRLSVVFPLLRNRAIDNMSNILLENAGELTILSADKGAEKEGYGCEYLIIDEAHKTEVSTLGIFQPFTREARDEGIGRISLIGIGGTAESAIEFTKHEHDIEDDEESLVKLADIPVYKNLRYDAEEMVHRWPNLVRTFAKEKATLSPADYDQHYRCLPVLSGTDRIFQTGIPARAEWDQQQFAPQYRVGIDPGKRADESVMTVIEIAPSSIPAEPGRPPLRAINVIDRVKAPRGMPYPEQARFYASYLNDYYPGIEPRHISCEYNGVGEGLADCLNEIMRGINYYWSCGWYNDFLIGQMQTGARLGTFGCPLPDVKRELEILTYTRVITPAGNHRMEWEHNDTKSSLIAAMYAA